MTPLHPSYLSVLRLRYAIFGLMLLPALAWADFTIAGEYGSPFGAPTAAGAILIAAAAWLLPIRRYRAWGHRRSEDELVVKHGLLVREVTVVPFGRVQHIDIAQGPIERMFGLATLVLNTAGTRGASVNLPGLLQEEAEALRDHVRAKIRQDLA